ncbi:hypothetical protein K435DRAFT_793461 [Dendrothele bispora CBS 962.96]|uniref:Uncharacterized protein n=1 Tax=Dendrothele bispora (strain CBS 962.96) TaxID=1314807 RepID=A0A4S8MF67_DENBC|nr:hypothetical protein K435DRAFT_793461 [Dendrothele bispora CBS 962.96]
MSKKKQIKVDINIVKFFRPFCQRFNLNFDIWHSWEIIRNILEWIRPVVTAHHESGTAQQSIGPKADVKKGVAENEDRSKADEDACSKLWAVYAGEAEKYDGELMPKALT